MWCFTHHQWFTPRNPEKSFWEWLHFLYKYIDIRKKVSAGNQNIEKEKFKLAFHVHLTRNRIIALGSSMYSNLYQIPSSLIFCKELLVSSKHLEFLAFHIIHQMLDVTIFHPSFSFFVLFPPFVPACQNFRSSSWHCATKYYWNWWTDRILG